LPRLAPEDVPGEAHVVLGRPRVADREPEHEAAAEARVREEHQPGSIHALEQSLVLLVASLETEADEREVPRRTDLPARLLPHPPLQPRRQADGLAGHAP